MVAVPFALGFSMGLVDLLAPFLHGFFLKRGAEAVLLSVVTLALSGYRFFARSTVTAFTVRFSLTTHLELVVSVV